MAAIGYLVATLVLGQWLLIALHEAGHAAAARSNGISVVLVRIGSGPGAGFGWGQARIELRIVPAMGMVTADPNAGDLRSWQRFVEAGPLTSVVSALVLTTVAILIPSPLWLRIALGMLAVSSLISGLSTREIELRVGTEQAKLQTDGPLWRSFAVSARTSRRLRSAPSSATSRRAPHPSAPSARSCPPSATSPTSWR